MCGVCLFEQISWLLLQGMLCKWDLGPSWWALLPCDVARGNNVSALAGLQRIPQCHIGEIGWYSLLCAFFALLFFWVVLDGFRLPVPAFTLRYRVWFFPSQTLVLIDLSLGWDLAVLLWLGWFGLGWFGFWLCWFGLIFEAWLIGALALLLLFVWSWASINVGRFDFVGLIWFVVLLSWLML